MKKYLIIPVFFIFCGYLSAQSAWEWVNPAPNGKSINDAVYAGGTIFVAGTEGLFMASTDKGQSWNLRDIQNTYTLNSLSFVNQSNGWLAGDNGNIFWTADGGLSFTPSSSGVIDDIYCIRFRDSLHGAAAGSNGAVLLTSDAGNTWSLNRIGVSTFKSIVFLNPNILLVTGENGIIVKSTDNGLQWKVVHNSPGLLLSDIRTSNGIVYAAGFQGTIFRSDDQGETWTQLQTSSSQWLRHVTPLSGSVIIASGVEGMVLVSKDAGTSWAVQSVNTTSAVQASVVLENNEIFFFGEHGLIFSSTDTASSFTVRSSTITENLNSVRFTSLDTGWIVGDRGLILKTTDGGESWLRQNSGTIKNINEIFSIDGINAWIVGDYGTYLRTIDGGENWLTGPLSSLTTNNLYTVYMSKWNSRVGGQGGTLFVSYSDWGATSWVRYESGIDASFRTFAPAYGRVGFLAADGGKLFKVLGALGKTVFQDKSVSPVFDLRGVFFTDQFYGWVVGKYGVIFKTTNGTAFSQIGLLNISFLNSVHFVDRNLGYTAGSNGKVFKTTTGGDAWYELPTNVNNTFTRVYFKNANNGWVLGAYGAILRTRTGGELTGIKNEVPVETGNDFTLHGNYPNPFNPTTMISFSLPSAGMVEVSIFDGLGREIARPISSEMQGGIHSVSFDAGVHNLSSGVYICTVRFKGSVLSNKILYLK